MTSNLIEAALAGHREAVDGVATLADGLDDCAGRIRAVLAAGGRILICGNGGSAADAQHFAAEFTGRFEKERRAYPAIALTTDSSALTAIGNDYGFENVFARQLEALGHPGDVLIAISTSGESQNVVRAVEAARANGISVIGLLGRDGGRIAKMVDLALIVPSARIARIQEAHILMLHILCELIEASS